MLILWGFIFSAIGMAFFVYGKKAGEVMHLILGGVLMVYPYFIRNSIVMVIVGVLLTAAPLIIRQL